MKTRTLTNKRWLPLAIVPLFSVAVLTGCSSDDDDDAGGGTTPPVVTDSDNDGTPDSFQVLDTLNANTDLVDANEDGIDDRDLNEDGLDDRDTDGNGIADEFQTPADSSAIAADSNGNEVDDSYEVAITGGTDANSDGIDDDAAALLAGGTTTGGTTTGGETTGSTTSGETTGSTTSGETTGGTTSGETTGGTTGGTTTGGATTGGEQPTGNLGDITFGDTAATAALSWDGTQLTGTVEAPDATEVALYKGIAASAGTVQRLFALNGSGPTFFMPSPLSEQENAPVLENMGSGNLFLQYTTADNQTIRSIQLLPPGNVVTALYSPLEVANGSEFNSNGAAFLNVNTGTGQYSAVATVNLNVDDKDSDGNPIAVAAAHIHSVTADGDVIVPLTKDSAVAFSATGTFSAADLQTIQQNNGWFNVHLDDGTTPGASLMTGQILFTQP